MTPSYLKRRGQVWYARLAVPAPLRPKLGSHIQRSLGTTDHLEALRRLPDVLASIRATIEGARSTPALDTPAALAEALRPSLSDPGVEEFAETLAERMAPEEGLRFARRLYSVPTLRTEAKAWLISAKALSTQAVRQRALDKLLATIGEDKRMADVSKRTAVECVDRWVASGESTNTVRNRVGTLSALWTFVDLRSERPVPNPWSRLGRLVPAGRTGRRAKKRAMTTEEARAVLRLPLGDDPKRPAEVALRLFKAALLTGMRVSELCALPQGRLTPDQAGHLWLPVGQRGETTKTDSSRRRVPVASCGVPEVLAWVECLPLRTSTATSYAARHKPANLGEDIDAHSCRRTYATTGEALGVNPVALARILGHRLPGLTFSTYSTAGSDEELLGVAEGIARRLLQAA